MKKSLIVLFLILTTALSCSTKYRNIHSFETVWQTVNQAHYDPTFGDVDWKAVHEQYKPQIAAAENKEKFFLLINQRVEYSFDAAQGSYFGPVVVLIDVRSTSSSEYFAGSMQAINRAVIVGEHSPGYLLIANWKKLLNGASFMYAFAQPIMPDDKIIEGNGVVPNIEIKLDRDALLKGKDTQLDAAVNYIKTKTE